MKLNITGSRSGKTYTISIDPDNALDDPYGAGARVTNEERDVVFNLPISMLTSLDVSGANPTPPVITNIDF